MVERDALEAGDIRTIPIPEPSDSVLSRAEKIFEYIKQSGNESLIDSFVFEIYRMKEYETYLVSDALNYMYNFYDRQAKSIAFRVPSKEMYQTYHSTLMDVLQNSLGQTFAPKAAVYTGQSPLSVLVLSINERGDDILGFFESNEDTEHCLAQLDALLLEERHNIYVRRNVRVYGEDAIYIVKPKQQRYWSYSSACRDADELFADIMRAKR